MSRTSPTERGAEAVYDELQTASWTEDGRIRAVLPLPPGVLGHHGGGWVTYGVRKNGSRYYASQYRIVYAEHRDNAVGVYRQVTQGFGIYWPAAWINVEWRFAGQRPDDDGAWTRLSSYRDAIEAAGIVADDQDVWQGHIEFVRVPRKYQCVVVTLLRDHP